MFFCEIQIFYFHVGKINLQHKAESHDDPIKKKKNAAIRHFNYREKKKDHLKNLHEFAAELDTTIENFYNEISNTLVQNGK